METKDLTKWAIDPAHSKVSFKVKHLMIANVMGNFREFQGEVTTVGTDFSTAEIDLWIDASSITTDNKVRDKHLKSSEFFDVKRHKQLTFVSSTIGQADPEGNHELWGELTIVGVTHNVKLNLKFGGMVNDPWGNERSGFTVSGKISRSDWGLTWNQPTDSGGLMVSDEVAISGEFELINMGQKCLNMHLS